MEFNDEQYSNQSYNLKDIKVLKSFFVFLKPYLKFFIFIIFLSLIASSCFTIESYFTSFMIDAIREYEVKKVTLEHTLNIFYLFLVLDIVVLILGSFLQYIVDFNLRRTGQNIIYDFRRKMFNHVLSLSTKQMQSLKIGSFVTRITNDTRHISNFFSDIFPQFVRALFSLIFVTIITFARTGVYGFIFVSFLPIVFLLALLFRRKSMKYYLGEKNSVSMMNSFLSESFSGIKITKSFSKEEYKLSEFDKKNHDIYSYYTKSQTLFAFYYPIMYLLQMSCVLLVFAFGIPSVFKYNETGVGLTSGAFYYLSISGWTFFQPIQQLAGLLNNIQSVLSSAKRSQFVLDMDIEIVDDKDAIDVERFKGKVEFKHVYFRYDKNQDYVLKDVSFVIYPGKTIGFVGATGAGKSTIISLITRAYEAEKGEILIDDINIKKYSIECLKRNIGLMMQDIFLFSGNIKDNISLFDENISDEEIIKNSKFVGLHPIIDKLPDKYNYEVTQRGENFSSGERQLISFARTLTYHPSLMLLDEATSNIDTETEHIIEQSLENMKQIGTLIIVAHRLSTIKNADHIFCVHKGKIIEEGNHEELIAQKGYYYNLYTLQSLQKNIRGNKNEKKQDINI